MLTARSSPLRISASPAAAWRLRPSSSGRLWFLPPGLTLANGPFQTYLQQLRGLHRELEWQLLEHSPAEAVDDHLLGVLLRDAALAAVEELVVAHLGGGSLVLHAGRRVAHLDVGHGVSAALVAYQQGGAAGEVPRAGCRGHDPDQAAIGVLPVPGGDALGDDGAPGVLPHVDHLGAGIGLLVVVDQRHGVELADRVIALEDPAGVLPGDGGAGFNLCPGDLGVHAGGLAPLGNEVEDAALALLVARVPVLERGVLDLRIVQGDELNYCSVELVGLADRRRAALQIAHVGALVRDDESPLELARALRIDAEVGHELQRTADA